jgi:hypothetical protein
MTSPEHSRTDLSIEDIEYRIRRVIADLRFPASWKPVELEYLNGLLVYQKNKRALGA